MSKDKDDGEALPPITGGRTDDKLLQVRGLNHSFSQALKQKLEREPAANLAPLFRQYEDHWRALISRYPPSHGQSQDTAAVLFANKSGRPSGGSLLEPPKAALVSQDGGREEEGTKSVSPSTIGEQAGKSMAPSATSFGLGADKPVQPFTFGFGKNGSAQPFNFGANTERMTATTTTSNAYSGVGMGVSDDGSKPTADKPVPEKQASFTFGSSVGQPGPFSFGGGGLASTPKNPSDTSAGTDSAPSFSFAAFGTNNNAAAATTQSSKASTTGPSPTTMSTPSFSFGGLTSSSSTATATAATPFSFSFSTPLPSFGALTQPAPAGANDPTAHEENDEGIPEGEEASFSGERTNTELIKRGVGEEGEETIAEERIKLFFLERDSGGGWKDLGIAIAKVNRSQDTGKRRLLARSEGTGKVLLNTWISGTATKVDHIGGTKDLTLICMGTEGKPVQYLMRCKEPAQAASFSATIINQQ